jgi:hypothetical protein
LAALALVFALLIMTLPERADLMPPDLRAGRLRSFEHDIAACRSAIASAGFGAEPLPPRSAPGGCGYSNAVELTRSTYPYSQPVAASCALAAGLALWERDVVTPAAQRRLHQAIDRIEVAGAPYQCRRIAGRRDHRLSEHAFANAIDIGGFTLADGRTISVATGWRGSAQDRAFLHDVRDGACRYFQAVLSPDYNRAHANHLHFDLGRDRLCR